MRRLRGTATPRRTRVRHGPRSARRIAFLTPWLIGFVVFLLIPLAYAVWISLTDEQLLRPGEFVGLDNYVTILHGDDPLFWKSLQVTLTWVLLTAPAVHDHRPGRRAAAEPEAARMHIFRTLLYVPAVLSGWPSRSCGSCCSTASSGPSTRSCARIGIENPPYWFEDPTWAMPALAIVGLWGVGGNAVIYLAGLQNIPPHLYEAAVDRRRRPVREVPPDHPAAALADAVLRAHQLAVDALLVFPAAVFVISGGTLRRRPGRLAPVLHVLHLPQGVHRGAHGLRLGDRLVLPRSSGCIVCVRRLPPREAVRVLRGRSEGMATARRPRRPSAAARLARPRRLHTRSLRSCSSRSRCSSCCRSGWMLTAALKPDTATIFTFPPEFFPTEHLEWGNFVAALTAEGEPYLRFVANTTFLVLLNMIGAVVSNSLIAYPFARLRFRGRNVLFIVLLGDPAAAGAGAAHPAVPAVLQHRLVRHLPAADRAVVHRQRVLHLPAAPVHAHHPARARRGGADRRRRLLHGLLADHPAADDARP